MGLDARRMQSKLFCILSQAFLFVGIHRHLWWKVCAWVPTYTWYWWIILRLSDQLAAVLTALRGALFWHSERSTAAINEGLHNAWHCFVLMQNEAVTSWLQFWKSTESMAVIVTSHDNVGRSACLLLLCSAVTVSMAWPSSACHFVWHCHSFQPHWDHRQTKICYWSNLHASSGWVCVQS